MQTQRMDCCHGENFDIPASEQKGYASSIKDSASKYTKRIGLKVDRERELREGRRASTCALGQSHFLDACFGCDIFLSFQKGLQFFNSLTHHFDFSTFSQHAVELRLKNLIRVDFRPRLFRVSLMLRH